MNHLILDYELPLRLVPFAGILVGMALWESLSPRRPTFTPKWTRWIRNLGMVVIDSMILRLVIPVTAISVASSAVAHGWGLFNIIGLSGWIAIALGVVVLDLAIYGQHVMFHVIPIFWRLHKVHHTDLDVDVTTGVRFHPAEVILSMGIKMGVVLLLGAPVPAVLLFEMLLNGTSMFNHGNVHLWIGFDRWLRFLIVTPDMHRVHHSVIIRETNSNFGFNLPWWDRLFGTYRAQPAAGHDRMVIGIARYRDPKSLTLVRLLALPLLTET
ncbi:MAG TPA: sterol desaturase family protein [Syntrophorhabdaceae bacterium]|nr:sterol desaturase family protein [Syntrophorhabdaceae bacterium]